MRGELEVANHILCIQRFTAGAERTAVVGIIKSITDRTCQAHAVLARRLLAVCAVAVVVLCLAVVGELSWPWGEVVAVWCDCQGMTVATQSDSIADNNTARQC